MQKNLLILLPWAGSHAERARQALPLKIIIRMLMNCQMPEDINPKIGYHSCSLHPLYVAEGVRPQSKFFSLVCGRPRAGILLGVSYSSMWFQPWAAAKCCVGSSTSPGDASRLRLVSVPGNRSATARAPPSPMRHSPKLRLKLLSVAGNRSNTGDHRASGTARW